MAAGPFSFSAIVDKNDEKMGLYFIEVPDEIAFNLSEKFPARVILTCHLASIHAGLLKRKTGFFLIQMGKQSVKKLKIERGGEYRFEVSSDQSEYGFQLSPEMEALLEQDEEGRKNWEALSPGLKRGLLHYVASAKSQEVRIRRSIHALKRAAEIVHGKKTK